MNNWTNECIYTCNRDTVREVGFINNNKKNNNIVDYFYKASSILGATGSYLLTYNAHLYV